MNKAIIACVVLAFTSTVAYADDARHQEMFAKMKQVQIEGMQGRIAIMQTALSCVNAATNHQQMKTCHQQEQQALEAHKQKHQAMMESMKPAGAGPRADNPGGR